MLPLMIIDKKPGKDYTSSREDRIMKRIFHSFKVIKGILNKEMKDGDSTIQQIVLPKLY